MQGAVEDTVANANTNTNEKRPLKLARQIAQQALKEFNDEVRHNSESTKKLRLMNESGGERRITSVVDPFERHEATSRAIQQLYSGEYGHGRQPRGLEVQYRYPAIFRMIQENKVRNTAKLKKLAELIKAKRSITLSEKRKNRENTLALVSRMIAETNA